MKDNKKLKTILVGSTPMAGKLIDSLERMDCVDFCGIVNLTPELAVNKANYDPMYSFLVKRKKDIHYTSNINDLRSINWIKKYQPDIILQAGWSQIFCGEILTLPSLFCIGIHAAPLPIGRGAAILNWKLIEGGGPWGNTMFIMEPKTDRGAILDCESFDLELRDDIRMGYIKADRTAITMIKRTLPLIAESSFKMIPQNHSDATRYFKRYPDDGKMYFEWPAEKILNYIRALTHPFPGAFFNTAYGKLIIWKALKDESIGGETPGTIIDVQSGHGVLMQVGNNQRIWLLLVTPPGDVEIWCDIWAIEQALSEGAFLCK